MSRLIGLVVVYVAVMLGCTTVGLFMLLAPVRFGNLVHDSLYLFPEVRPRDWGKKLILRLAGIGMLAFALRLVLRIAGELG